MTPNKKFLKKTRYFFKNKTQFRRKTKKHTKFHSFYNAINQLAVYKLQKKITSFQNFRLWAALEKTACFPFFSLSTKANHRMTENFVNLSTYFLPNSRRFEKDFSKPLVLFQKAHQSNIKKKKVQQKQLDSVDFNEHSCFFKVNHNSSRVFLQNLFVYKILKSHLKQKKHCYNNYSLDRSASINHKLTFNTLESKYRNYLESSLSSLYDVELDLIPFRVKNDWQHANYLADEIVYFLERRIPFRRLKNKILKQLSKISTIRGVRITCSGRVGGKSKKAQRAKTECIKYGQTSLQVFSSKIDFSMKTAFTSFGSVGVKVWICYY